MTLPAATSAAMWDAARKAKDGPGPGSNWLRQWPAARACGHGFCMFPPTLLKRIEAAVVFRVFSGICLVFCDLIFCETSLRTANETNEIIWCLFICPPSTETLHPPREPVKPCLTCCLTCCMPGFVPAILHDLARSLTVSSEPPCPGKISEEV